MIGRKNKDRVLFGDAPPRLTDPPPPPKPVVVVPMPPTLDMLPPWDGYFKLGDTEDTPSAITGATGSASLNYVLLSWDISPYALWRKYEVYEGTTAGFTPNTTTFANRVRVCAEQVTSIKKALGTGPWYYKVCATTLDGLERSPFVALGPFTMEKITDAGIVDGAIKAIALAEGAVNLGSDVIVGNLGVTHLASADALIGHLNTGTAVINNAIIGVLSADKLATPDAIIGRLNAGTASINSARIASLEAGKITTGALAVGTTITVGTGANQVLIGEVGFASAGGVSSTRVGTWESAASTAYYGGTAYYSNTPSSTIQWSFTGTYVRVYAMRTSGGGKVNVFIDGALVDIADTYRAADEIGIIGSYQGLADTSHTVKLEVSGTHNVLSSGDWLYADRIEYAGGAPVYGIRVTGAANIIQGALIRTAASGNRVEIGNASYFHQLAFFHNTEGYCGAVALTGNALDIHGAAGHPIIMTPDNSEGGTNGYVEIRGDLKIDGYSDLLLPTHGVSLNVRCWFDNSTKRLKVNDGTTTYEYAHV